MQSMASFVSQNVGAGNKKRAEQSMLTGIGIGRVQLRRICTGVVQG